MYQLCLLATRCAQADEVRGGLAVPALMRASDPAAAAANAAGTNPGQPRRLACALIVIESADCRWTHGRTDGMGACACGVILAPGAQLGSMAINGLYPAVRSDPRVRPHGSTVCCMYLRTRIDIYQC